MEDENSDSARSKRLLECLENSLNASLGRVLFQAHSANAISYNRNFRGIFLNRLAEDLWYHNPLHPEREKTSICDMPFVADSNSDNERYTFTWGMSRNRAATIIQVYALP